MYRYSEGGFFSLQTRNNQIYRGVRAAASTNAQSYILHCYSAAIGAPAKILVLPFHRQPALIPAADGLLLYGICLPRVQRRQTRARARRFYIRIKLYYTFYTPTKTIF